MHAVRSSELYGVAMRGLNKRKNPLDDAVLSVLGEDLLFGSLQIHRRLGSPTRQDEQGKSDHVKAYS
jgi:hypothetical protein